MWGKVKGAPALVDSTSARYGDQASSYSGVCLEAGEMEAMPIAGNSSTGTSVAFVRQVRARYAGPLVIYWDNAHCRDRREAA